MRLLKDQDWRAYLAGGDETSRELLEGDSPLVSAMNDADRFFSYEQYASEPDLGPVPAILGVNAHMYLLAAARTALSGHQAAVFPLVRTALESGCYAYLTAKTPELGTVWIERH